LSERIDRARDQLAEMEGKAALTTLWDEAEVADRSFSARGRRS